MILLPPETSFQLWTLLYSLDERGFSWPIDGSLSVPAPIRWQPGHGPNSYAAPSFSAKTLARVKPRHGQEDRRKPGLPWICHALLEMGKADPRKEEPCGNDRDMPKSIHAQRWSWGFQRPQWQSDISSLKGLGGGDRGEKWFSLAGWLYDGEHHNHMFRAITETSAPLFWGCTSNQRISSCALFTVDIFWLIGEEWHFDNLL